MTGGLISLPQSSSNSPAVPIASLSALTLSPSSPSPQSSSNPPGGPTTSLSVLSLASSLALPDLTEQSGAHSMARSWSSSSASPLSSLPSSCYTFPDFVDNENGDPLTGTEIPPSLLQELKEGMDLSEVEKERVEERPGTSSENQEEGDFLEDGKKSCVMSVNKEKDLSEHEWVNLSEDEEEVEEETEGDLSEEEEKQRASTNREEDPTHALDDARFNAVDVDVTSPLDASAPFKPRRSPCNWPDTQSFIAPQQDTESQGTLAKVKQAKGKQAKLIMRIALLEVSVQIVKVAKTNSNLFRMIPMMNCPSSLMLGRQQSVFFCLKHDPKSTLNSTTTHSLPSTVEAGPT